MAYGSDRLSGRLALVVVLLVLGSLGAPAHAQGTWTGFYFGGLIGGGWSGFRFDAPDGIGGLPPGTGTFPAVGIGVGIPVGAHLGYTTQRGVWVFGAEAAVFGTTIDGTRDCGDDIHGFLCAEALRGIAMLTGHIGYSLGAKQFFISAGPAWAREAVAVSEPAALVQSYGVSVRTVMGWTVSAGVVRQLSHGVSVRADYTYVRLPSHTATLTSPVFGPTAVALNGGYHIATFGFSQWLGTDQAELLTRENGGWVSDMGLRTWLNVSQHQFNLFDASGQPISRLAFSGGAGFLGEGYLRVVNGSGLFVNAATGTGAWNSGQLVAESFPPAAASYSRTISDQEGGRFTSGFIDVGRMLVRTERLSLGAFGGMAVALERYQAIGCTQTAASTICVPAIPGSLPTFTRTIAWAAVRLGGLAELALGDRVEFRSEVTVNPIAFMYAADNRWLEPDLNTLVNYGPGLGLRIENTVTLALTDTFSLGAGGRFEQLWARGPAFLSPVPGRQTTMSRHYGAFVQLQMTLGE